MRGPVIIFAHVIVCGPLAAGFEVSFTVYVFRELMILDTVHCITWAVFLGNFI